MSISHVEPPRNSSPSHKKAAPEVIGCSAILGRLNLRRASDRIVAWPNEQPAGLQLQERFNCQSAAIFSDEFVSMAGVPQKTLSWLYDVLKRVRMYFVYQSVARAN